MYCTATNLPREAIIFGKIQAMAIHLHTNDATTIGLKEAIQAALKKDVREFNIAKLENYPTNECYDYFTILGPDISLFVGCAIAKPSWYSWFSDLVVIFDLAPSENETNNSLYKVGEPCSACPFDEFNCSTYYTKLCGRPQWNMTDRHKQDASFLGGFETKTTTTTSTTSTTPTTTTTSTTIPSTTPTTTTTSTTTPSITLTTTTISTTASSITPSTITTSTPSITPTATTTSTTTKYVPEKVPFTEDGNTEVEETVDFDPDKDLIESTTTTELTTTKSSKSKSDGYSSPLMLVPSRYIPLIMFISFLVRNINLE